MIKNLLLLKKVAIIVICVVTIITAILIIYGVNNMNQSTSVYSPRFDMYSYNDNFYYRLENDFYLHDWQNKQKKLLYSEIGEFSDLINIGENIYFTNENKLYLYSMIDNLSKLIYTFDSDIFLYSIFEENIFLSVNKREDDGLLLGSELIKLSLKDNSAQIILSNIFYVDDVKANGEKIFYIIDNKLFSMNYDGSRKNELYPELEFEYIVSCDKNRLVVIKQKEEKYEWNFILCEINMNNIVSELSDMGIKIDSITSYGNNIYFSSYNHKGIYCYTQDGKIDIVVGNISGDQLCVSDKGIYIYNVFMKLSYYDFISGKIYEIN